MRLGVHCASESDLCPRASRAIRDIIERTRVYGTHSWGREQFSTTKSETLTASDHESLVSSGCFVLFCMRVNRTREPESPRRWRRERGVCADRMAGRVESRGQRGAKEGRVSQVGSGSQIAVICRHKLPRSDNRPLRSQKRKRPASKSPRIGRNFAAVPVSRESQRRRLRIVAFTELTDE